jgi:hypothetical protein
MKKHMKICTWWIIPHQLSMLFEGRKRGTIRLSNRLMSNKQVFWVRANLEKGEAQA